MYRTNRHGSALSQKIPQIFYEYAGDDGHRPKVYAWLLVWECGCTEYEFV